MTGSNQSAEINTAFATALQVKVLDINSQPVAGAVVAFTAPASSASATFSSPICTTDASGLCSVSATANSTTGTYTATAAFGSLSSTFTLTNTGAHSFIVTVATDSTTGVAANCIDQTSGSHASNANCSLRDALSAAASVAAPTQPATITFAQTAPSTITLAHGTLNVPSYTTVQGATSGSGSSLTNLITIDGNNAYGIFTIASGVLQASINNLIITRGNTSSVGGGIFTEGTLSVSQCSFTFNIASSSGGAISNEGGNLTVFGSTFSNNQELSTSGYGGAIDNFAAGTIAISNSTFTTNTGEYGGAIYSHGLSTITNSTIVGNTAPYGAGVYNLGGMTLTGSIVDNNSANDCWGLGCFPGAAYVTFAGAYNGTESITIAFTDSKGNSFSQSTPVGTFSTDISIASTFGPYFYENFSGLDTASITGQSFGELLVITPLNGATLNPLNITYTGTTGLTATQTPYPNPLSGAGDITGFTISQLHLSALGNNGGPTQTMLPLAGSVALCVVSPSAAPGTDQRGQPRFSSVNGTTCQDSGAVQTPD